jgi:branched-subunit amino acid aminotransferase/4-amino-4-deoxychorismate lyase
MECPGCSGETAALIDSQGNITEGPEFNIFAVKNSKITTPAGGVLQGLLEKQQLNWQQTKAMTLFRPS